MKQKTYDRHLVEELVVHCADRVGLRVELRWWREERRRDVVVVVVVAVVGWTEAVTMGAWQVLEIE